MSLWPDLTPLINEFKQLNQQIKKIDTNQILTNQLLTQIKIFLEKENQ